MTDISQFALDLLDELSTTLNDNERWQLVLKRLADFGFNALNLACFTPESGQIHWVRSSMSSAWLEEYDTSGLSEVDPLLAQVFDGVESRTVNAQLCQPNRKPNDKAQQLQHGLAVAGYHHMFSLVVACPGNEAKLVVLSSGLAESRIWMEERKREMRILTTVIATSLGPETNSTFGQLHDITEMIDRRPRLTPRETDVLSLLATGLRNDRIAEALNVSEVTVRTHLRNARDKLEVPTREAALVRALQLNLISPPPHRNR